jgi:hypothetical protein
MSGGLACVNKNNGYGNVVGVVSVVCWRGLSCILVSMLVVGRFLCCF